MSAGNFYGARLCEGMKIAKSLWKVKLKIEEDLGWKVSGLTLGASKDFLLRILL